VQELGEQVAHQLIHEVAGGLSEQAVELHVQGERSSRIHALRPLLGEQHPGPCQLLVRAVAGRELHDLEGDVAAELQDLAQQVQGHRAGIAEQGLDHLEGRRLRDPLDEGAETVAHLQQPEVLEPLDRLSDRGPVDLEGIGQLPLVGKLLSASQRSAQNARPELLEYPVRAAEAGSQGLELDRHAARSPAGVRSQTAIRLVGRSSHPIRIAIGHRTLEVQPLAESGNDHNSRQHAIRPFREGRAFGAAQPT
jgi:hypothetical protein